MEYEVTIQKPALQHGVCERVHEGVCTWATKIKLDTLRASLMYAFRRTYDLPYKMATFIATEGVFNTVYSDKQLTIVLLCNFMD